MARFASLAEYYRHHRRCFALAQELGVTPREAELELERRAVRARFEDTHRRFLDATAPRRSTGFSEPSESGRDEPWMMRD